jgi:hypothetical protein
VTAGVEGAIADGFDSVDVLDVMVGLGLRRLGRGDVGGEAADMVAWD